MKKRVLAVLFAGVLACSMLMACGDEEATAVAEEATEAAAEASSEFTFEDLQENYAAMTEAYDAVEKLYMDDAIEQSDDVEELLTEAKDVIDQMGELTEADFANESELLDMNNSILDILNALDKIIDMMDTTDAASASGSVSEGAFADLQENYATLVETYQLVEDAYMSDAIAQDDTVEELLTEAKGLIDEMGELSESDFTSDDDINTMNTSILQILEGLDGIVDLMQ
ncbi:MAG: hypothetical protein K6E68_06875 [Lachnospiraceae bacterium]|nr:hypothetical protein [Lachnospiraceae bacterium]